MMSKVIKPVIVAIDDDPVILTSLITSLKEEYSIRPFTSGKLALDFLFKQKVDLILLDYKMPDMTGFEILNILQYWTHTCEIPVIFLTGSANSDTEVKALELGAVDYITKPFQPRSLLTRVKIQLELQNHRKHLESLVEERTKHLNEAYNKLKIREEITLNMLAKITDLRDHDTGNHIERTTAFVRIIVEDIFNHPQQGYSLDQNEVENIISSSKLHDIGKIAIPDHILLKPGRLTIEEFDIVKQHPINGEQFFDNFIKKMDDSFLETARIIAYSHHEKWDGSGYPLGLKGEDIPLPGRIIALADVYDALTSKRPYKDALSHKESVRIIIESSGTHFDPYLVKIFLAHKEEFHNITITL